MADWLVAHENGSLLRLHIQPGSSKNEIMGLHGGRLKIKIKAQPMEGEANKTLVEYLSEVLKISKKKIFLLQGESSRQKKVFVELSQSEVINLVMKK
jgi:uncharacterized protein (TIGR00251 family)